MFFLVNHSKSEKEHIIWNFFYLNVVIVDIKKHLSPKVKLSLHHQIK